MTIERANSVITSSMKRKNPHALSEDAVVADMRKAGNNNQVKQSTFQWFSLKYNRIRSFLTTQFGGIILIFMFANYIYLVACMSVWKITRKKKTKKIYGHGPVVIIVSWITLNIVSSYCSVIYSYASLICWPMRKDNEVTLYSQWMKEWNSFSIATSIFF